MFFDAPLLRLFEHGRAGSVGEGVSEGADEGMGLRGSGLRHHGGLQRVSHLHLPPNIRQLDEALDVAVALAHVAHQQVLLLHLINIF